MEGGWSPVPVTGDESLYGLSASLMPFNLVVSFPDSFYVGILCAFPFP